MKPARSVPDSFTRSEQAAEAIRFRQILDGNVMRRLLALRFELLDLAIQVPDGLLQLPLFPLVTIHFFLGQL